MYRTSSPPRAVSRLARLGLALVAVCLVLSLAPMAEMGISEPGEQDSTDDLLIQPWAPMALAAILLLHAPARARLSRPFDLKLRIPRPPTQ